MQQTLSRHVPLDGASNFRDFGGYPTAEGRQVKWRRLFRSDRLSELTAADHARLAPLGIRHVYDLRRLSELAAAPTRWPGPEAPRLLHRPLFVDEAGPTTFTRIAEDEAARHDADLARGVMAQLYARLVTEDGPRAIYREVFEHLADPAATPALFHCSAGKDRTGVTCALILGALGVSRADVTADFMLTKQHYEADAARQDRIAQIVAEAGLGFWSEEALLPIFTVEQGYLDTALDLVAEMGGTERFLAERVGVSAETLEGVRRTLVD
ncbi:MAG TPA: tyrosine-protein phosphatase [Caulobacteraceae bacterium]|nr:tyrosine-protein phosphatase [Caulobacteraceae bacterium]